MNNASLPRPDALLSIKIAPPRPRRWWLPRERLLTRFADLRERPLLAVQAPAGYGKTSFLASLRREWLASGAYVSWLTLDARDDAARFAEGLLRSLGPALGQPATLAPLIDELAAGADPIEIIGRLLSLLGEQAHPVAMFFDDLHAVPTAVADELMPYVALNLPANVHVLVGSRHALPGDADDQRRRGNLVVLDQSDLCFRLEESLELLRLRFGPDIDADSAARVHDAIDGWPLGVQMAISIAERADAPALALARLGEHAADLRLHAAEAMLASLEPAVLDFLVALVPLERLHPELCTLLTGREDAAALLIQLNNETPVLQAAEGGDWYRMHAVCRHALRPRFEALPETKRKTLHWRAAQWLHGRQLLDEAAEHALAAERSAVAYEWIAAGLHDMVLATRFAAALAWLERLPPEALTQHPALGLALATAHTLTYQHEAARRQLDALAAIPLGTAERFELAQIRGALAHYSDDYATIAQIAATVGAVPAQTDATMRAAHVDMLASLALHRGDTAAARYELRQQPWPAPEQPLDYGQCYAQFFRAYTDWIDARVLAADANLLPYRPQVEARFGRRSAPACLLAALHAAVMWDQGRDAEAEAALADRLDVVERTGSPIAVSLAYRTLIRAAWMRGARLRAEELTGNLAELGRRRDLPRLIVVALNEQLRIETATPLNAACLATRERLRQHGQGELARHAEQRGLGGHLRLALALAEARVALCRREFDAAGAALAEARQSIGLVWPQRAVLELQVLEATHAEQSGAPVIVPLPVLAATAAELGWQRLIVDVWPAAAAGPVAPAAMPREAVAARPPPAVRSVLLTDKENDVLELLARNYTNKEIARALDIGGETAKWHVKNIAGKLSAGGRRHIVERARLLGLVGQAE